jgi:hypothetical protein
MPTLHLRTAGRVRGATDTRHHAIRWRVHRVGARLLR